MFHQIRADTGTRSSQTGLAVHGESLPLGYRLKRVQDLLQDLHGGTRSVHVEVFHMPYTGLYKVLFVIILLVEPDDEIDFVLFEIGNVVGGCQRAVSFGRYILLVRGSGEGEDLFLAAGDPIQITVLRSQSYDDDDY